MEGFYQYQGGPYRDWRINLDGKVNVTDVTTLVNMIHNGETANLELADINADGKVNVSDVTALVNIILK